MFEKNIAGFALVIICIISLVNVIARYFTDISFAFTEEISVVLLVIISLFGAAVASKNADHIKINIIENKLKGKAKRILYIIQFIATIIVLSVIIFYGIRAALQEFGWESLSPGLGLPYWWYLIWLPIGCFFILFREVIKYIQLLQNLNSNQKISSEEK